MKPCHLTEEIPGTREILHDLLHLVYKLLAQLTLAQGFPPKQALVLKFPPQECVCCQPCLSKSSLSFQARSPLDISSRKSLVLQPPPRSHPPVCLQALLLGCSPLLGWDKGEASAHFEEELSLSLQEPRMFLYLSPCPDCCAGLIPIPNPGPSRLLPMSQ